MSPPSRARTAAAAALAGGLAAAVTAALLAPSLRQGGTHLPTSAFSLGHSWVIQHVGEMALGQRPLGLRADDLSWPVGGVVQPLLVVPALLFAPLQPLLGPLWTWHAVALSGPAASAASLVLLLRRLSGLSPWAVVAPALAATLAPFTLVALANGQLAKTQLWCLVLPLLAAVSALAPGRPEGRTLRALPLVGLALATLAASITSPSLALHLPLALGGLCLLALARSRTAATVVRCGAVLASSALAMLPAGLLYARPDRSLGVQATLPANAAVSADARSWQILRLDTTVLGQADLPASAWETVQGSLVPWPLLVGAAAGVLLRGRGWRTGLVVAGVALVFGVGPVLWWGDGPLTVAGGYTLALPAALFEVVGYPLADSGMYVRLVQLLTVGLVVLLAAAAARLGPRRGPLAAGLLSALALGLSLNHTASVLPRAPLEVLPAAAHRALDQAPPGAAVLDLPLYPGTNAGERTVAMAALHGRPTSGSLALSDRGTLPHLTRLEDSLTAAAAQDRLAEQLAALGFGAVLHDGGQDTDERLDVSTLTAALGPPAATAGSLRVWHVPGPVADRQEALDALDFELVPTIEATDQPRPAPRRQGHAPGTAPPQGGPGTLP